MFQLQITLAVLKHALQKVFTGCWRLISSCYRYHEQVATFEWTPSTLYLRTEAGAVHTLYGRDVEVIKALAPVLNFTLKFTEPPNGEYHYLLPVLWQLATTFLTKLFHLFKNTALIFPSFVGLMYFLLKDITFHRATLLLVGHDVCWLNMISFIQVTLFFFYAVLVWLHSCIIILLGRCGTQACSHVFMNRAHFILLFFLQPLQPGQSPRLRDLFLPQTQC